jgi:hypothetical protein
MSTVTIIVNASIFTVQLLLILIFNKLISRANSLKKLNEDLLYEEMVMSTASFSELNNSVLMGENDHVGEV